MMDDRLIHSLHPAFLRLYKPHVRPERSLDVETKSGHAALVLGYEVLACLLGIGGGAEQHALVATGLFVLADTAGLENSPLAMR